MLCATSYRWRCKSKSDSKSQDRQDNRWRSTASATYDKDSASRFWRKWEEYLHEADENNSWEGMSRKLRCVWQIDLPARVHEKWDTSSLLDTIHVLMTTARHETATGWRSYIFRPQRRIVWSAPGYYPSSVYWYDSFPQVYYTKLGHLIVKWLILIND